MGTRQWQLSTPETTPEFGNVFVVRISEARRQTFAHCPARPATGSRIEAAVIPITLQIVWLFVLAIPIACVAWTVTHEEVLREPGANTARSRASARRTATRGSSSTCLPVEHLLQP